MITEVHIQNYRSIWDAKVKLSPFTLLIGANGAGKSNFLRLFDDLFNISEDGNPDGLFEKHLNHQTEPQKIAFIVEENDDSLDWEIIDGNLRSRFPCSIRFFSINPITIGNPESLAIDPVVNKDGAGAVQVLDALKTGDREDLFDTIEQAFQKYIPEVEKLSFVPRTGKKQLQVREKHFQKPILLKEVSEGTRFILTILTIIYQ
ncbi:MAG: AAA family ATPase [Chloroflexota bacterium]